MIGSENRLYEDLTIICYSPNHRTYLLGIVLPGIIIWSKNSYVNFVLALGIPTYGFYLI